MHRGRDERRRLGECELDGGDEAESMGLTCSMGISRGIDGNLVSIDAIADLLDLLDAVAYGSANDLASGIGVLVGKLVAQRGQGGDAVSWSSKENASGSCFGWFGTGRDRGPKFCGVY